MKVCLVTFLLCTSGTSRAELPLRVRGRSVVAAQAVRGRKSVRVRGRLTDELGHALAARKLNLSYESDGTSTVHSTTTGEDGAFDTEVSPLGTTGLIQVEFPGDTFFDPRRIVARIAREDRSVRVQLVGASFQTASLDSAEFVVGVRAESASGADAIDLTATDEGGHDLASAQTGATGEASLRIPTTKLGGPGTAYMTVRSRPDERRDADECQFVVVKTASVRLVLSGRSQRMSDSIAIDVWGRLTTRFGALGHRAVDIVRDGKPALALRTDSDGAFRGRWNVDERMASHSVFARFDSDAPWLLSAKSNVVRVTRPASESPPWALGALLAAACVGFGYFASQRKQVRVSSSGPVRVAPITSPERWWAPRRMHYELSFTVVDRRSGTPVDAQIELIALNRSSDSLTLQGSAVQTGKLSRGAWELRIRATGFAKVSHSVVLPHHGDWIGRVVEVGDLRDELYELFRGLQRSIVGTRAAGWTGRDLLREAHARGLSTEVLREVVDRFERWYYGPHLPDAEELDALAIRMSEIDRVALT